MDKNTKYEQFCKRFDAAMDAVYASLVWSDTPESAWIDTFDIFSEEIKDEVKRRMKEGV